jgi:hypothetical protein
MVEERSTEAILEQLGVKVTAETYAEGKSKTTYDIPLVEGKPAKEVNEELMQIKPDKGFHFSAKVVNGVGGSEWVPESLLMKSDPHHQGLVPPENAAEALETAINTHNWQRAFKDGIVSAEVEISNL